MQINIAPSIASLFILSTLLEAFMGKNQHENSLSRQLRQTINLFWPVAKIEILNGKFLFFHVTIWMNANESADRLLTHSMGTIDNNKQFLKEKYFLFDFNLAQNIFPFHTFCEWQTVTELKWLETPQKYHSRFAIFLFSSRSFFLCLQKRNGKNSFSVCHFVPAIRLHSPKMFQDNSSEKKVLFHSFNSIYSFLSYLCHISGQFFLFHLPFKCRNNGKQADPFFHAFLVSFDIRWMDVDDFRQYLFSYFNRFTFQSNSQRKFQLRTS